MDASNGTYRGLPGAFGYSFRSSRSLVFKAYVLVAGASTILVGALFALALVGVVASTLGASELVTFVRAFFILVGVLVIIPLVAPVLLVARRHRLAGERTDDRYDRWMALGGFGFLLSLYLGLLLSVPPAQQAPVDGLVAPIVATAYGLPGILGIVPPVIGAASLYLIHRRLG